MKKVLHVLDHSLPLHSGYSFRSKNIINFLNKKNVKSIVITSSKHQESQSICFEKEIIEDIEYYRCRKIRIKIPVLYELLLIFFLLQKMKFIVKKFNVKLIHAHSPVLNAIPALIISKFYRVPIIYEIRAFWEDAAVDLNRCKENGIKYKVIRYIEAFICKKVDVLITICDNLKKDLLQRNGLKKRSIEVVPNAVDLKHFNYKIPVNYMLKSKFGYSREDFILGFIGSFYHYEGLDFLIESVPSLIKKNNNFKIILIGGGPENEKLMKKVKDKKLCQYVKFTGRIDQKYVPDYYSIIDALIFPRIKMKLTDLVTPLKPLEAIAMNKLVIASDVGGHKELIKNHGILFEAQNKKDLLNKLCDIYNKRYLLNSIRKNAYKYVKDERSWEKNTQRYLGIYKKL